MDDLQRLIAIEDIRRLKARYIRCMDTRDWDGMLEIWMPDGVLDLRLGGSKDEEAAALNPDRFSEEGLVHGSEAIVEFMSSIACEGFQSAHFGHMPEIDILSESEATAIWSLEDFCWWDGGRPYRTLHGFGHWHDRYVKSDGVWKISRVHISRIRVNTTS
ncbi:SnoaL-like domain-containing protein [Sphingobium faniae]|nr:SnoaL-like domain-containing protein [Sphingobium faniae]